MSAKARVGLEQVNLVVSMFVEELAQQRGKYRENSETRGGGRYPCCTKTRDARADYCYSHFMSASNAVEGTSKVEREEVLGLPARWHRGGPAVLVTATHAASRSGSRRLEIGRHPVIRSTMLRTRMYTITVRDMQTICLFLQL